MGEDLQRCTQGHVEIIEMGALTGRDAENVTHNEQGVPNSCYTLDTNWFSGGKWQIDPTTDLLPPTEEGSLSGSMQLIDIESGLDYSYDAISLVNFSFDVIHTRHQNAEPNLASGNNTTTLIVTDEDIYITTWNSSIDAVSALFMQNEISNDFVIDPTIGAQTSWVNIYPTKQFYTDSLFSNSSDPLPPFNSHISNVQGACIEHRLKAYDREQDESSGYLYFLFDPGPIPNNASTLPFDCDAASVEVAYPFNGGQTDMGINIFGHPNDQNIFSLSSDFPIGRLPFHSGWMTKYYNDEAVRTPSILTGIGINGEIHQLYGKPVLGFVAQKYTGTSLPDGITSNYGVLIKNRGKIKMVVTD